MRCAKCEEDKSETEFYPRKDRPRGRASRCKACQLEKSSSLNYPPQTEGEKFCEYCASYHPLTNFFANKKVKDGRYAKCKSCENIRKIRLLNKFPHLRVVENIRRRTRAVLSGHNKSQATMDLVGVSRDDLMKHLESMFLEGMNWENYGEWHIDHIRPCSSFDLSDPKQQKICFHYTNLQPMWAEDNLRKAKKYE